MTKAYRVALLRDPKETARAVFTTVALLDEGERKVEAVIFKDSAAYGELRALAPTSGDTVTVRATLAWSTYNDAEQLKIAGLSGDPATMTSEERARASDDAKSLGELLALGWVEVNPPDGYKRKPDTHYLALPDAPVNDGRHVHSWNGRYLVPLAF